MKLTLKVTSSGTAEGKVIPIRGVVFLIGRDAQCQLRPVSPQISNRHCSLQLRDGKAYICDLESTNGTFVNGERIKGEVELQNDDRLKLGPLTFLVCLSRASPDSPRAEPMNDEEIAQILLEDSGTPAETAGEMSSIKTMLELALPPAEEPSKPPEKQQTPAKPAAAADTRRAAESLLAKYARRETR